MNFPFAVTEGEEKSSLLGLTDELRDDKFPEVGIRVDDSGSGG